jgi:hypothetical protein
MTPVDFNLIDYEQNWWMYKGKLFSGIAYLRHENGTIAELMGFVTGWNHGCARSWTPTGVLVEEEFYHYGAYHGPVRCWSPDGSLISNDYYPQSPALQEERKTQPVVDIDLDTLEFVEHAWGWGKEPFSIPSFDEFQGFTRGQGDKECLVIKQSDGREVLRIESMLLRERQLHIAYKRRSLRISDSFAEQLVQAKILQGICANHYSGRFDAVTYEPLT